MPRSKRGPASLRPKPAPTPGRVEYIAIAAVGSRALAEEVGLSKEAVAMRLRRGQTADEIRAAAQLRQAKIRAGIPVPGPPGRRPSPLPPFPPLPPVESNLLSSQPVGLYGNITGVNGSGTTENILQAQLRKEIALADQQRLKADEMAGRLVDRAEVERWVSDMIVKARDMFMRIGPETGDRLAVEIRPSECAQIVEAKVREVLGMLAAGVYRS